MPTITGIFGLMGTGKTMLMTRYGKKDYDKGKPIYSNYHLKNIEYTPINTLDDIQKMHNCTVLFDELWLWLFARTSQSNLNKEIMKIIFLNRKRNVTIYYTAQLSRTIDVLLREATQFYVYPQLTQLNNSKWHISFYVFNRMGQSLTGIKPMILKEPLEYWGSFYDTTEEITQLKKNNTSPLQEGIRLENEFIEALQKIKQYYTHILLPNSGISIKNIKGDVLFWNKKGKQYVIDVKSATDRVFMICGNELKKQYQKNHYLNFETYIAFPDDKNKKGY